ncbi:hydroxymethylbilane synthase [Helicobacter turcicus]|uniref:Porphobilinogen deaminase n=1 Tax=Helicobacter turcicus TaxID=2867412 RepID=A0ABS7JMY6_9HELI|nr:hydroxymethylbilane synthase [Helicobacter turcicus]MBX7490752.1 hydroxymethylbilane synthase [Helicobacter turcicus]MBX7545639.1 hydroxymethylbilane synthase [Helicobacter turcicus]
MQKLTIGTRGSVLALWQANHIKNLLETQYPTLLVELKIVKTKGDKILDVPLAKIGGKGLFTKELEMLLLDGSIDLAVHSLKDVPVDFVEGLGLAAITRREDVRDSFLSFKYESLESLQRGARVGTTSLRRVMQINALREDLDCQSLRGNVQTRLQRLENGEFDAIILAQAGVNRLELKGIPYIRPLEFMIPAMGQAALGIECREDSECVEILNFLNDKNAVFETHCERAFVRALNGGCQVPIGINASYQEGSLKVRAILGLPDGSEILKESLESEVASIKDCEYIGITLAESFLKQGAKVILEKAQNWQF